VGKIIDGRAIAAEIRREIRAEVDLRIEQGNRPPYLAVVLVGDDPASLVDLGAGGFKLWLDQKHH